VETGRADRLIEDPLARPLFEAAGVELPMRLDWPPTGATLTRQEALHLHGSRYIGLRTRFYDDQLREATDAGLAQVVLFGAGLDARAYRLGLPSELRIFELDRGALLGWKRTQLRRLEAEPRCVVTDVDVDLREDWVSSRKLTGSWQLMSEHEQSPGQPDGSEPADAAERQAQAEDPTSATRGFEDLDAAEAQADEADED
jgi:methyltransferase (TIGR00027 family)